MDNSPFGRPAAELREEIFEYALTFDSVRCIPGRWHRPATEPSLRKQLALTQVCRQIRRETLHLPFTLNDPIVGRAPDVTWLCRFRPIIFSRSCKSIVRNVNGIPPSLLSDSTVFRLDLHSWAHQLLDCSNSDFYLPDIEQYLEATIHGARIGGIVLEYSLQRHEIPCFWCLASLRAKYHQGSEVRLAKIEGTRRYDMRIEMAMDDKGKKAVARCFVLTRQLIESHYDHWRHFDKMTFHQEGLVIRSEALRGAVGKITGLLPGKQIRDPTDIVGSIEDLVIDDVTERYAKGEEEAGS